MAINLADVRDSDRLKSGKFEVTYTSQKKLGAEGRENLIQYDGIALTYKDPNRVVDHIGGLSWKQQIVSSPFPNEAYWVDAQCAGYDLPKEQARGVTADTHPTFLHRKCRLKGSSGISNT